MKKLAFLFLLGFVLMFSYKAKSQAEVDFSKTLTVWLPVSKGSADKEPFVAQSYTTVLSASGNITKIACFQLPEGHFLIPKNGMNYIALTHPLTLDDEGKVTAYMVDDNVKINSKGEFRVRFHSNGAGNVFPNWSW
ncbi:hypothetical protein [Maribellus sp. YY47]|uniref:hypothetical protein n=1 Tax=Maribellus sp. YY47 TaxID=2929486 RepID=UPI002001293A|nr:hypothetical protein [Maribellus sp. YY47]MCK3683668.1 hypothetical protein [Maribellus sp. YY47]